MVNDEFTTLVCLFQTQSALNVKFVAVQLHSHSITFFSINSHFVYTLLL